MKDQSDQRERERSLQQQQQDLKSLKRTVGQANNKGENSPSQTDFVNQASTASITPNSQVDSAPERDQVAANDRSENEFDACNSSARGEWEHQKKLEFAQNEALDSLMDMIGLEDVKEKFLSIKARVDTSVRQNVTISEERFGAVLLGNPGTGTC